MSFDFLWEEPLFCVHLLLDLRFMSIDFSGGLKYFFTYSLATTQDEHSTNDHPNSVNWVNDDDDRVVDEEDEEDSNYDEAK